jgi:hypothetical protein
MPGIFHRTIAHFITAVVDHSQSPNRASEGNVLGRMKLRDSGTA